MRRVWALTILVVAAGAGLGIWFARGAAARSEERPRDETRLGRDSGHAMAAQPTISPFDELREAVDRNQREFRILSERLRARREAAPREDLVPVSRR